MGDPCSPVKYAWDGLTCSSTGNGSENIIRVDLSISGLSGNISGSFARLNNLTYLDLSYNNLTGAVLYTLTTLPFLTVLNLSENKLSGRLPVAHVKRAKDGLLVLQIDGNDDLCGYQNSCKGDKEVRSLMKVHHKNLVTLIGYCMEREQLELVFEYIAFGCFKDHLTGRNGTAIVLSWKQRLQIVYEAAKGLDYLHIGCDIIHRDVKSSNILLGQNLEAKISDFGFSKLSGASNRMDRGSYIGLVGTPGYIDPELSMTLRHTYKSDVYSFGVVLLEMLTGEPPNRNIDGDSHIADRVASKIVKGNIDAIMDPKLHGDYCPNSAWKVVDLAMWCVALSSYQRPTMVEVVLQLKECLDLVTISQRNGSSEDDVQLSSAVAVKTIKFAPGAR